MAAKVEEPPRQLALAVEFLPPPRLLVDSGLGIALHPAVGPDRPPLVLGEELHQLVGRLDVDDFRYLRLG